MLQRSYVRIPALYTGWTFFTFICCKDCNDVCLKRRKQTKKRPRMANLKEKNSLIHIPYTLYIRNFTGG